MEGLKRITILFLSVLFIALANTVIAGGDRTITRSDIGGTAATSSYLTSQTVSWYNGDTVSITLKSDNGTIATLAPGETKSNTFTATTTYYVESNTSVASRVLFTTPLHTTNVGSSAVGLSWGAFTYYDGTPTYGYQVLRTQDSLNGSVVNWSVLESTSGTSYTDSSVQASSHYYYMVNPCTVSYSNCVFHTNTISVDTTAATQSATTQAVPASTSSQEDSTTSQSSSETNATTSNDSPVASSSGTASTTSSKTVSKAKVVTGTSDSGQTSAVTEAEAQPKISILTINGETMDPAVKRVINGASFLLSGVAQPNASLLITVYSDPKKFTVLADDSGSWELEVLTDSLEAGEHTVTTQYLDSDGNPQGEESEITAFEYAPLEDIPHGVAGPFSLMAWLIAILILVVIFGLWIIINKRRAVKVANQEQGPTSTDSTIS